MFKKDKQQQLKQRATGNMQPLNCSRRHLEQVIPAASSQLV
jgi:hypothetical protein